MVHQHSSSDPDLHSILLAHTLSNDPVRPNLASGSTMPSLPPFSLDAAQASISAIINQPHHATECVPASQPSNAWVRKALNIIAAVECKVLQASAILPYPHQQSTLDNATLQQLLDNTVEVVESAGRSLAAVKHKDDIVQKRKAEVMVMLSNLDLRARKLGGLLPPRHLDTTPVLVDAGERILYGHLTHY